jgi:predicted nucleotidyltransferase
MTGVMSQALTISKSRRVPTSRTTRRGKPHPAILADIVKRVVRAARPERIVMFGSAARGTMGPNSDIDLLVIKEGKFNYWRLLRRIHKHLSGKQAPVDVVIATPEDVERYRHSFCLVICPALEEGKVIYDSKALSAGRSTRVAKSSSQQSGSRAYRQPRRAS